MPPLSLWEQARSWVPSSHPGEGDWLHKRMLPALRGWKEKGTVFKQNWPSPDRFNRLSAPPLSTWSENCEPWRGPETFSFVTKTQCALNGHNYIYCAGGQLFYHFAAENPYVSIVAVAASRSLSRFPPPFPSFTCFLGLFIDSNTFNKHN